MSRIAIIDLLFNWPPDGGARVDVKEIASRLAAHHDVRLFVPDYRELFPRGAITGDFSFAVTKIPFSRYSFNLVQAPRRFSRAVDDFRPDHVFVADGWHLKPYIVNALRRYRPVVRFYAYECFCLQFQGTLFRNDEPCRRTVFDGMRECLACTLRYSQYYTRLTLFSQEMFAALAVTPFYPRVLSRALAHASRVICYNERIKTLVTPHQPNVTLAPSGIDTDLFSPGGAEARGVPVVLMTSRVHDQTKGFHILEKAVKILRAEGLEFRVVVPVAGVHPPCGTPIDFIPWKKQEDLPALYRSADVCVIPSVGPEPFGIVTLEAMACGKPVVASRIGGLPLIVEDGVGGFLVPAGDVDALAAKIRTLLLNEELRARMGAAARRRSEGFEWDRIMRDIYLPLFDKPRR
jgi:glycosyltransferase involved in cell wall biosynthesis